MKARLATSAGFAAVKKTLNVSEEPIWLRLFINFLVWGCILGFILTVPAFRKAFGMSAAAGENAAVLFNYVEPDLFAAQIGGCLVAAVLAVWIAVFMHDRANTRVVGLFIAEETSAIFMNIASILLISVLPLANPPADINYVGRILIACLYYVIALLGFRKCNVLRGKYTAPKSPTKGNSPRAAKRKRKRR